MRTLLLGVFGGVLLIMGSAVGVGGLGLLVTDSCSTTYRLSIQPADSGVETPSQTTSYAALSQVQQTAVDAALENRTRMTFRSREPLADVTETVVEKDGNRYVAHLDTVPCRTPFDELALVGFTGAVIGLLLVGLSLIVHRHS